MRVLLHSVAVALAVAGAQATEVSVCRDATYDIPAARGAICSGAGAAPAGKACPRKGDVSVAACHSYLPSFDGKGCVAKEDATCQIVNGNTWGCVFPSVGCGSKPTPKPTPAASVPVAEPKCATWDYEGDDVTTILLDTPTFDGVEVVDSCSGADPITIDAETNASIHHGKADPSSDHAPAPNAEADACSNDPGTHDTQTDAPTNDVEANSSPDDAEAHSSPDNPSANDAEAHSCSDNASANHAEAHSCSDHTSANDAEAHSGPDDAETHSSPDNASANDAEAHSGPDDPRTDNA
ncbi:hypothetical protein ATCC90586_009476 [Pythium insidiosum]|nr:hypothetical protein ATCC90586_009476 [Pythium insidiosum]